MSRRTRPGGVMPAMMFVAVDVECAPCRADGLRRRLARFGRSTGPGADPEVWAEVWHRGGERILPEWVPAPGGGKTVRVHCPYGHARLVRRDRVVEALDAIPPRPGGWHVARVAL